MSNPVFLSEGTAEHRLDTVWKVLQKILTVCNTMSTLAGGSMANPTFFSEGSTPHRNDTEWKILMKILGALTSFLSVYNPSGGAATHGNGDPNGVKDGAIGTIYVQDDAPGVIWTKGTVAGILTGWASNA